MDKGSVLVLRWYRHRRWVCVEAWITAAVEHCGLFIVE